MSESLYMTEIELLLEEISKASCSEVSDEQLEELMAQTKAELISRYHLNPDDAEGEVLAAAGLEP